MRSRDFIFWLQGFLELSGPAGLSITQVLTVKRHLSLALEHETDSESDDTPILHHSV